MVLFKMVDDIMEGFESILTRRSIRKYKNKKIPDLVIDKILMAAISAPSAGNEQPWQFMVIDDKKILEDITNFLPNGKFLPNADKAILVCGDINLEKHKGYWHVDCSAATQNILLTSHIFGIGSCWLGVYPKEDRIKNLKKYFKMPENIIPFSLISLGYPDEDNCKVDRYNESRIHKNKW